MTRPYLIVDNAGPQDGAEPGFLAVCVTSLEGMGRLTSLFGSEAAGAAAAEYAARLEELLRDEDELIPINESKHCVLLRRLKDRNHAELAGLKLQRLFDEPFDHRGAELPLVVRSGIACGRTSDTDAEALFRAAETAREVARSNQRIYQLADGLDFAALQRQWQLNDQVDGAIRDHRLKLFYQPKVAANGFALAGAEGLIRWDHEDGLLAPGQFLPYLDAEKMLSLTRHVIRQCIRDLAADPWLPALSFNLEPAMLKEAGLIRLVLDELSLWDVDPSRLVVEVTENGLMDNLNTLCREFTEMRERGVRVAIDDFGTGHSSLAQFKGLPLDELKIDRSFVANLEQDEASRYLTSMIVDLGHFFGLSVVGEGVESLRSADILAEFGCDLLQGFHFAPPLSREEFARWAAVRAAATH